MLKKIKLKNFWKYLDNNILLLLSSLLLIVIPLYPKLPLFDIIPGYIVRVRIEDFLILFTIGIFLTQLIRKKVTLKTPLTKIIFAYIVIGLLSTLSGIFITKTIPTTSVHLLKSFLHYLRYLEYFSLFFIFYTSVKSIKDLKVLVNTFIFSFTAIGVYGVGQKYFYWPVYSTMNREFSKGIRLYLTEHARVQSTFGGHYDMAAYLVILLPIIFLLTQHAKKRIVKILLWLAFSLGTWLMVMSAARTSFVAVIIGLAITILLRSFKEKETIDKIKFFISKSTITGLITLTLVLSFGKDISERLLQSLQSYPAIDQAYDNFSNTIEKGKEFVVAKIAKTNILTEIKVEKPENSLSVDEATAIVASDTRPTPIKPSDVFVDVPDRIKIATISATGETEFIIIEVPRTYSENALKHGLSLAIRLDTLWPQALNGFYKNPALGTGYATLTKSQVDEFTEADSTDNNFLRTLGEIGLLGFIAFYGTIALAIYKAYELAFKVKNANSLKVLIAIAFIGSTIGLLINAVFIDVFAASKVALTFWSLTGILFALGNIKEPKPKNNLAKKKARKKKKKGQFKNAPKN